LSAYNFKSSLIATVDLDQIDQRANGRRNENAGPGPQAASRSATLTDPDQDIQEIFDASFNVTFSCGR
jgi:hypothetical protein